MPVPSFQLHQLRQLPPPTSSTFPPPSTTSSGRNKSTTMPALDRPKRTLKSTTVPPTKISLYTKPPSKSTTSKAGGGSWATSKILAPTSAVALPQTDIHAFLVTCISGFANYTETEKRDIISSLPPSYRVYDFDSEGKLVCPISTDFVMSDAYLRRGVARFKKDVGEGIYEERWMKRGKEAMAEREKGEFDEYLKRWVEEMFGEGVEGDEDCDREGADAGQTGGRGRAGKKPVDGGGGGGGSDEKDNNENENEEADNTPTSSDGEWHQAQDTTKKTIQGK